MLRAPEAQEPELLTDWMEASLLVPAAARVSDAELQDVLNEAGLDGEEALQQILQQFNHRSQSIGARYPIERAGLGFQPRGAWDAYLCYSFLLFVSLNQSYTKMRFIGGTAGVPAALFEIITGRVLELFLGGRAIRIGSPREPPVPVPFPDAIDHLSGEIREPVGARDLEAHDSGDDGLDLWVFKAFQDSRPSQLFLIAQCAIGTDWPYKRSELDARLWKRHIDWFSEPLKAFAVPFQIGQPSWRETATRGGLVLDRPRIAATVEAADLPGPIVDRIRNWTQARIASAVAQISA